MNTSLTLRYFIELCMILPAAAISILPVCYSRKVRKSLLFGLLGIMLTVVIAGGAVLCAMFGIRSNTIVFLSIIVFFPAYHFCFDVSLSKKIFCFANATKAERCSRNLKRLLRTNRISCSATAASSSIWTMRSRQRTVGS